MKSYIKCKDVDFESSREECFYDLQLNVKNKSNGKNELLFKICIIFKNIFQFSNHSKIILKQKCLTGIINMMRGVCFFYLIFPIFFIFFKDFGLQPAEKGLKFLSFPPVLYLQLMRFQYDPLLDANVKINDRCFNLDLVNIT